jgi:hypothetical protein
VNDSFLAQLLRRASLFDYDARFTTLALTLTIFALALLHAAEFWGHARARRLTARAIAQTERSGLPEAQTWEHSHSAAKIKLHKESR